MLIHIHNIIHYKVSVRGWGSAWLLLRLPILIKLSEIKKKSGFKTGKFLFIRMILITENVFLLEKIPF